MLDWDYTITHLRDRFAPSTDDPTWITQLGSEGDWVIISGDERITRGPETKEAWKESGLTAFFFGKGYADLNMWKQVEQFFHWWPEIRREAREHRDGVAGSGYLIRKSSKEWRVIP